MNKLENNKESEEIVNSSGASNWIQRLKDESWEAELLVSAIAIYGTFQLFGLIDWATNKFIDVLSPEQRVIGYFIVFTGLLAVSILVSMFVIHFFLRAYWVGLVGLNSVFPDYSLQDSAYSEIYTKKILSILPKLKDSIQKVDALCSVIFSAAFCILLIYAYIAITSSIYLFIYNWLAIYVSEKILMIPIALIALIFILQTLIAVVANLKTFKQNDSIQQFYFIIVKLASILMFGPLYKNLLQITMIFGSNFKKNKGLVRLIILFISCGLVVAVVQVSNTNIFYLINKDYFFDSTKAYFGYYESENTESNFLLTPEIDSDVIKRNVIRLFIPIFDHEKNIRQEVCKPFEKDPNASQSINKQNKKAYLLDCYHLYNLVYLNEQKVTLDFMKYFHPRTQQFGILGYIGIENLKRGKNVLTIRKSVGEDIYDEWSIPFYFTGNSNAMTLQN